MTDAELDVAIANALERGTPREWTALCAERGRRRLARRDEMPTGVGEQAENIVDAIIDDLTDRKGLRHAWDNIDESIQAEIRSEWMLIARRVIEQR